MELKFSQIQRHYGSVLWVNSLTLLAFLILSLYAKVAGKGENIGYLFQDPFTLKQAYYGLFTSVSEVLWSLSATVCLFSFRLLRSLRPTAKPNVFLLYSGLGILVLMADDMFRISLIMDGLFGIPKGVMYSIYGMGAIIYGLRFWRKILSTPYILLLVAGGLFVLSGITDSIGLHGYGTPAMLEDGTRLWGILNIALYFWQVCKQEIRRPL